MDAIVDSVILELDVVNGVIQDTAKNYRLIASLDKVFQTFSVEQAKVLLPQLTSSVGAITDLSNKYFISVVSADVLKRFDKVVEGAKEITDLRFGLKGGKFVRGGVLETIFKEFGSTEVKNIMSKAVSGNMDKKEFLKQMRGFVTGTDEKPGISERKWKQFAYDVYQQHDAAYNKKLAEEFDMKYFIYQGGLIRDSRDFCAAHNNKVWTTEEAEAWKEWTPNMGEYPAGYEVKAKLVSEVPSYMNYPGYDPLVDRGGYNCRHQLGYISEELAYKLRPELKGSNKKPYKEPIREAEKTSFVEAENIQNAEQRLRDLGIKDVTLKGLNIDYANAVLRAVGSEAKLGNFSLAKIETYRRSNSLNRAVYSPSNNSISINLSKIKTVEQQIKDYKLLSYEEQLQRAKKDIQFIRDNYEGKPNYNQNTVYSRINAFNNEIYRLNRKIKAGETARPHTVSYTFNTGPKSMESSIYHELGHYRMDKTFKGKTFSWSELRSVSEYGRTNMQEYFAEWYSQYRSYGEYGIPKDLLEIFKSL
jgi:hypothetical protein